MLRISALRLRALWSRTASTLPAAYSTRLEVLASCFARWGVVRKGNKEYAAHFSVTSPCALVTASTLPDEALLEGENFRLQTASIIFRREYENNKNS